MMQTLITAFLAILAGVIGASLQYWFLRTSTKENNLREERQKAYSNFLQGVALQATSPGKEAIAIVADAKSRIAIYGSDLVISRLAAFHSLGPNLDNRDSVHAYLNLVQSMRAVSYKHKSNVDTRDLKIILFGRGELY
jgi:hypothetical protein